MFGGSWTFIILFLATLVAWVVLNSVVLAWYAAGGFHPSNAGVSLPSLQW